MKLKTIGKALAHPTRIRQVREASFWWTDLVAQQRLKRLERDEGILLPPASLRYRVNSTPDIDNFLQAGRECSQDIQTALERIGKSLASRQSILDFGCGCGRTLLWLHKAASGATFHGTDVDAEAIAWCSQHLDFASFHVNQPLPPLEFPDDSTKSPIFTTQGQITSSRGL